MANDLISDDWVTFTPSQPTSNDGMLAYVGQTLLASPLMTARGHNPRPTNIFIVIVAPSHSRSLTRPKGNRIERAPLRNGFKLTSAPPIKSNGCRFKLEWFNDYFRCWRLNRVSKQWKASEILFEQKKNVKKNERKRVDPLADLIRLKSAGRVRTELGGASETAREECDIAKWNQSSESESGASPQQHKTFFCL